MNHKSEKFYQRMFRTAALFNIVIAILLALFQKNILPWLGMEPVANEVFLQLFLGLVFVFGIGYYQISKNSEKNRNIIWLGFWGKLIVAVLLFSHAALGNISWGLASFGLGDLLFALLFLRFLFI
jgi:hypothetical protein